MTRTLPSRSALVVLLVSLVVAAPASARPDGAAQLQLVWPADGTVTSPFGVWRGDHRHEGIDIGMLRTLRLRAVAEGVVRETGYAAGYEGYGDGRGHRPAGPYSALYAHLSRGRRAGRRARPRRASGSASPAAPAAARGTHLHFELKRARRRRWTRCPLPRLESAAARAVSSVGRAPARQAGGHWFEPSTAHHTKPLQTRRFCRSRDHRARRAETSSWARNGQARFENVASVENNVTDSATCPRSRSPTSREGEARASRRHRSRAARSERQSRAEHGIRLEGWLLDEGLAEPNGEPELLVPTQRAFEIIELLDFFG